VEWPPTVKRKAVGFRLKRFGAETDPGAGSDGSRLGRRPCASNQLLRLEFSASPAKAAAALEGSFVDFARLPADKPHEPGSSPHLSPFG
jgi:hypothetical protein